MATHSIAYRVQKDHMGGEPVHREVAVCATPEELQAFGRDGFLIREAAVGDDRLHALGVALDRLTETEWPAHRPPLDADGAASLATDEMPARSWGVILRHLLDKDAAFHDLLAWPPAGSMVIIHANLWHRGLATRVGRRRMLILSYTPCWLRESPHGGPPPADGLSRDLLADGNAETRELLGLEGHS